MAHEMTRAEWRAFLSEGTRTGKLATMKRDGSPHVGPIWFVLDGDDLVFNTGANTVKGRALRRDPRAALLVDDERRPFAFVLVEGAATFRGNPPEAIELATRIGARYMGEKHAVAFGRRNAVDGELLVRLTPTKVVARSGVAD